MYRKIWCLLWVMEQWSLGVVAPQGIKPWNVLRTVVCMYCTVSADLSGFALGNQGSRGSPESSNYALNFCQLLIKVKPKMTRMWLKQCCCIFAPPLHTKKKFSLYQLLEIRTKLPQNIVIVLSRIQFLFQLPNLLGLHQCFSLIRGEM